MRYRLLKSAAVGITVFAVIYLLAVFTEADFNIANWSRDARGVVSFFGGVVAFYAAFFAFMEMFND